MTKVQATVPLMVVLSAIGMWDVGLSIGLYNLSSTVGSQTASISDIKSYTRDVPTLAAEVNFLAEQKGYSYSNSASTTAQ